MLATLLILTFAAAPSPTCKTFLQDVLKDPGFQAQVAGQLKAQPGVYEKFQAHVLEGCGALPATDLSCLQSNPGMASVDACPFAKDLLQKALFAPDVMDPKVTEQLQRQAMQSEAKVMLRAMGTGIQSLWAQANDPNTFHFPAAAGPTPAMDCCKGPNHQCPLNPSDWAGATWQALDFQAYGPTRYRFSFLPKHSGKKASFTLRAEGDPACTGKREVWEVKGTRKGDHFELTEPTQVR